MAIKSSAEIRELRRILAEAIDRSDHAPTNLELAIGALDWIDQRPSRFLTMFEIYSESARVAVAKCYSEVEYQWET